MATRHHDLLIIGTGSGNTILTEALAGLDVAIAEEGAFGGTCLNVGCIPTKMFVYPADVSAEARSAGRLGVAAQVGPVSWGPVRDRVFGRIDPIAASGRDYRAGQDGVTVYPERVQFVAPRTVRTGSGTTLSADRVVVAAGGRPRGLAVAGLQEADPTRGVHTSDTVMRMESVPARVAVVGGGYIAAEFAHVLASYGARVVWIHRGSRLLDREESAVAERFTALAGGRFDVRLGTVVTSARHDNGVWRLRLGDAEGSEAGDLQDADPSPAEHLHEPPVPRTAELEVDAVLLAVGRVPNTDLLDARAGGLELHPDGRMVVDRHQRTSVDGVYALGDICTPYPLKHVANHEARVVAHNLAVDLGRVGGPLLEADHRYVPHAVFTHPQVASFGPTGRELAARGVPHVGATQRYADVAYGWAMEDDEGFLTVYANPMTGRVISAHCIGHQASLLIQPLVMAASFGLDARDMARGQYWPHPALTEVVENALLALPLDC